MKSNPCLIALNASDPPRRTAFEMLLQVLLKVMFITTLLLALLASPAARAQGDVSDDALLRTQGKMYYDYLATQDLKNLPPDEQKAFRTAQKESSEKLYEEFGKRFRHQLFKANELFEMTERTCYDSGSGSQFRQCGIGPSDYCQFYAWETLLASYGANDPVLAFLDITGANDSKHTAVSRALKNCRSAANTDKPGRASPEDEIINNGDADDINTDTPVVPTATRSKKLALPRGHTLTMTADRAADESINLGGEGGLLALPAGHTLTLTADRAADESINLGGEGGLLALPAGHTLTLTADRAADESINLGGEGGLLALPAGHTLTLTADRAKGKGGGKGPGDSIPPNTPPGGPGVDFGGELVPAPSGGPGMDFGGGGGNGPGDTVPTGLPAPHRLTAEVKLATTGGGTSAGPGEGSGGGNGPGDTVPAGLPKPHTLTAEVTLATDTGGSTPPGDRTGAGPGEGSGGGKGPGDTVPAGLPAPHTLTAEVKLATTGGGTGAGPGEGSGGGKGPGDSIPPNTPPGTPPGNGAGPGRNASCDTVTGQLIEKQKALIAATRAWTALETRRANCSKTSGADCSYLDTQIADNAALRQTLKTHRDKLKKQAKKLCKQESSPTPPGGPGVDFGGELLPAPPGGPGGGLGGGEDTGPNANKNADLERIAGLKPSGCKACDDSWLSDLKAAARKLQDNDARLKAMPSDADLYKSARDLKKKADELATKDGMGPYLKKEISKYKAAIKNGKALSPPLPEAQIRKMEAEMRELQEVLKGVNKNHASVHKNYLKAKQQLAENKALRREKLKLVLEQPGLRRELNDTMRSYQDCLKQCKKTDTGDTGGNDDATIPDLPDEDGGPLLPAPPGGDYGGPAPSGGTPPGEGGIPGPNDIIDIAITDLINHGGNDPLNPDGPTNPNPGQQTEADTISPVVIPPDPVTVDAVDANGAPTSDRLIAAFLAGARATDNVGVAGPVSNDAPAFFFEVLPNTPEGHVTKVTFTARDAAGNAGSAASTVTVIDREAPVLSVPAAISVTADPGTASVPAGNPEIQSLLNGATATDNVDNTVAVTNDAPASFDVPSSTPVTFTATDKASNTATAVAVVTIQSPGQVDTEAPTVTPPDPVTVAAIDASGTPASDPGIQNFLNGASATDTVDGPVTASAINVPTQFSLGPTEVTFAATDRAGNMGTAKSTLTIADQKPPVVIPPDPVIVDAVDANGAPTSDGQIAAFLAGATATDNVDATVSITHDAPAFFFEVLPNNPSGHVTTVTFTATDAAGNTASAASTVTVIDRTPPVLEIPGNIAVTAAAGETSVPASDPAIAGFLSAAAATDNVDATVTVTNNAPDVFGLADTVVTFTATDMANNTTTAVSVVTVNVAVVVPSIFGTYAMTCTPDGGDNPKTPGQANTEMEGLIGQTFPSSLTAMVTGADLNDVTVSGFPPTSASGPAFVSAGNPDVVQSSSLTGTINIGGQDFFMLPSPTWFTDIGQFQVRWGIRAPGAGFSGQNLEAFWQCNGFK